MKGRNAFETNGFSSVTNPDNKKTAH